MTFKCAFKSAFKSAFTTSIITFITRKIRAEESRRMPGSSRVGRLPERDVAEVGVNRIDGGGDTLSPERELADAAPASPRIARPDPPADGRVASPRRVVTLGG